MRVVWSPLAIERATEAAAYIAKDSPEGARRWIDELFAVVATLAQLPERGRRVPDLPARTSVNCSSGAIASFIGSRPSAWPC